MIKTATARQFNQEPSRLLHDAERGATVVVEKYEKPVAALVPMPLPTSGQELGRRLARMQPQPQAAAAVAAAIQGMDEAE